MSTSQATETVTRDKKGIASVEAADGSWWVTRAGGRYRYDEADGLDRPTTVTTAVRYLGHGTLPETLALATVGTDEATDRPIVPSDALDAFLAR